MIKTKNFKLCANLSFIHSLSKISHRNTAAPSQSPVAAAKKNAGNSNIPCGKIPARKISIKDTFDENKYANTPSIAPLTKSPISGNTPKMTPSAIAIKDAIIFRKRIKTKSVKVLGSPAPSSIFLNSSIIFAVSAGFFSAKI